MKTDTLIGLGVAAAAVVLSFKISEGVNSALSSTGEGINSALSGAGSGLNYSGMGVYELSRGAGSGIEYISEGVGSGVAGLGQGIGSGVQNVGEGVGYATSGLNAQDIIQTIFSGGKEASTYKSTNLKNNSEDTGLIPTAASTLGLKPFQGVSILASWVTSQASKIINPKQTITGNSILTPSTTSSSSLKTSSSSLKTSSTATKNLLSISSSNQDQATQKLLSFGQSVNNSSLKIPVSKKKEWYNPLTWF